MKKTLLGGLCLLAVNMPLAHADTVQWINHFDLLSGNPRELTLTTNSTSAGVAGVGSLAGVVVRSGTVGETFADGGNKVAHLALNLPPQPSGIAIRGVRVCFESSNSAATFVSQIRIAEVQNPPSTAVVRMDDGTDLTQAGPQCVTSRPASVTVGNGPLVLSLRFKFGSTNDAVVIRGLGIILG